MGNGLYRPIEFLQKFRFSVGLYVHWPIRAGHGQWTYRPIEFRRKSLVELQRRRGGMVYEYLRVSIGFMVHKWLYVSQLALHAAH